MNMNDSHTRTIDLPTQAALNGIPGFADLLGGGCCLYALNATSSGSLSLPSVGVRWLVLPVELRTSFFSRDQDKYGQLQPIDVDTPIRSCAEHGRSAVECALRRALLSARFFRELHETRHRLIMGEYTSSDPLEGTCAEITQLCWDGHTGQVALCDTDFIALTVEGHTLPFPSSVSDRAWGHFNVGGPKSSARSVLIDMPCSFGRSILLPLSGQGAWQLKVLADELAARNALLAQGAPVSQMSFSCIEAWIAAAVQASPSGNARHIASSNRENCSVQARCVQAPGAGLSTL